MRRRLGPPDSPPRVKRARISGVSRPAAWPGARAHRPTCRPIAFCRGVPRVGHLAFALRTAPAPNLICRFGASPGKPPPSIATMNKSLAHTDKSRMGAKATNKRPAERRNFWHRQVGETRCGVRAAGRHRPLAARSRNGQSDEKMYPMSRTARIRCPLP